jgi:hypothetical protein
MAWNNPPLTLYHGCDDVSARAINSGGVSLRLCHPRTDFSRGFYTTTVRHQAQQWANTRVRRLRRAAGVSGTPVATLLEYCVDREQLAGLEALVLVVEGSPPSSDFWKFIGHCRGGTATHKAVGRPNSYYEVVLGLVSLWPQTLVIKDCDQVSFHSTAALAVLSSPVNTHYAPKGLF